MKTIQHTDPTLIESLRVLISAYKMQQAQVEEILSNDDKNSTADYHFFRGEKATIDLVIQDLEGIVSVKRNVCITVAKYTSWSDFPYSIIVSEVPENDTMKHIGKDGIPYKRFWLKNNGYSSPGFALRYLKGFLKEYENDSVMMNNLLETP